ncbi:hypothetical protein PS664_00713 [Pseudomonas fluorescens]|nr:hypothetical protein PS664_00713 [Pseudomonas fluorescens]
MRKLKSNSFMASKKGKPDAQVVPKASLFSITPDVDTETLLANAAETISSASALLSNMAFELDGAQTSAALGVQQMLEQGLLLVEGALERVAPV